MRPRKIQEGNRNPPSARGAALFDIRQKSNNVSTNEQRENLENFARPIKIAVKYLHITESAVWLQIYLRTKSSLLSFTTIFYRILWDIIYIAFSLLGILDDTLYLFKYPPFVTAHKNKGKWKRACDSATIYCQFRCTRESIYPLKTVIEVSHYFSFSFLLLFFFLWICFSFCRCCTRRKKCSVFEADAFIYDNIIQTMLNFSSSSFRRSLL